MASASNRRAGHFAWWHAAAATIVVAIALWFPLSANAAETLKGVALVIGNGDYEHLSKLENPEHDANDVEELLDKLGFDTTATADRDARRLRRDLEGFAEDAEGADVAVLYYSGHGIEAGGRNYLVPVDADLSSLGDAGESLVAVDALIEKLKAEVPIVIVMLDACRNNPFPADAVLKLTPGGEALPIAVSGLGGSRSAVSLNPKASADAPADANLGMILAFAAEPGKVALDGEPGSNSPYAAALLRHLSAMAGDEFGMVMRMVAEEVYLKTAGQQRPWVNESMRRLLYLGRTPDQPTGAEGDILTERRGLLVTIAALPDRERRTIETVAADTGVPMDALYGMLKALGSEVPEDPEQLDALLRGQTEKVKAMIAERDTLKTTDPEILRLSALADQALAEGALNTAISLRQQAKERAKEVEATVEDAEAQLRQRRIELAEVYSKSAEAYALAFKHREAALDYEEAARQVEQWDDEKTFWYLRLASSAFLDAGKFRGGPADLEKAVDTGRRAVEMAERRTKSGPADELETREDVWAQSVNNLANATNALYAATGDQQALQESIDAFRQSLTVLRRDRVPMDWAVVQNNLAGALSSQAKDAESLANAIVAYEAALTVWTREASPERWAIALANMADAQRRLAMMRDDEALLRTAIANLEKPLEVQTKADMPVDWAWTEGALGSAYSDLARLTRKPELREDAIRHYRSSLEVRTVDSLPRLWAQVMHNIAVIHQTAADAGDDPEGHEKALAIYSEIVATMNRDENPNEWALSRANMGVAQSRIGKDRKDAALIEQGLGMVDEARAAYAAQSRPEEIARCDLDEGDIYVRLGQLRGNEADHLRAIEAYERARAFYRTANLASDERGARRGVAYAQLEIGYLRSRAGNYEGALESYRAGLANRDRETEPVDWAFAQAQIAISLHNLGAKAQGTDILKQAAEAYRAALVIQARDKTAENWRENQLNLANVLRDIGERGEGTKELLEAAAAYAELARTTGREKSDGAVDGARGSALSTAASRSQDSALWRESAQAYANALVATDLTPADRASYSLSRARALYPASDTTERIRETLAAYDVAIPLLTAPESKGDLIAALLDRANLIRFLTGQQDRSVTDADAEATIRRAIALADPQADAYLLQSARQALANMLLAQVESPDLPLPRFDEGLAKLRDVLSATPKQENPTGWAEIANWYGYALAKRSERDPVPHNFEEAAPLLREAVATFRAHDNFPSVAFTEDSLCTALIQLGRIKRDRIAAAGAVDSCESSLAILRERKLEETIPITEAHLAQAKALLAELGGQP